MQDPYGPVLESTKRVSAITRPAGSAVGAVGGRRAMYHANPLTNTIRLVAIFIDAKIQIIARTCAHAFGIAFLGAVKPISACIIRRARKCEPSLVIVIVPAASQGCGNDQYRHYYTDAQSMVRYCHHSLLCWLATR